MAFRAERAGERYGRRGFYAGQGFNQGFSSIPVLDVGNPAVDEILRRYQPASGPGFNLSDRSMNLIPSPPQPNRPGAQPSEQVRLASTGTAPSAGRVPTDVNTMPTPPRAETTSAAGVPAQANYENPWGELNREARGIPQGIPTESFGLPAGNVAPADYTDRQFGLHALSQANPTVGFVQEALQGDPIGGAWQGLRRAMGNKTDMFGFDVPGMVIGKVAPSLMPSGPSKLFQAGEALQNLSTRGEYNKRVTGQLMDPFNQENVSESQQTAKAPLQEARTDPNLLGRELSEPPQYGPYPLRGPEGDLFHPAGDNFVPDAEVPGSQAFTPLSQARGMYAGADTGTMSDLHSSINARAADPKNESLRNWEYANLGKDAGETFGPLGTIGAAGMAGAYDLAKTLGQPLGLFSESSRPGGGPIAALSNLWGGTEAYRPGLQTAPSTQAATDRSTSDTLRSAQPSGFTSISDQVRSGPSPRVNTIDDSDFGASLMSGAGAGFDPGNKTFPSAANQPYRLSFAGLNTPIARRNLGFTDTGSQEGPGGGSVTGVGDFADPSLAGGGDPMSSLYLDPYVMGVLGNPNIDSGFLSKLPFAEPYEPISPYLNMPGVGASRGSGMRSPTTPSEGFTTLSGVDTSGSPHPENVPFDYGSNFSASRTPDYTAPGGQTFNTSPSGSWNLMPSPPVPSYDMTFTNTAPSSDFSFSSGSSLFAPVMPNISPLTFSNYSFGFKEGGLVGGNEPGTPKVSSKTRHRSGFDPGETTESGFQTVSFIPAGGAPVGNLTLGTSPGTAILAPLDPFLLPQFPGGGFEGGGAGAGDGGGAGAGDGGGGGGDGGIKKGGLITRGNPKSKTDDVPAMLQHGEYVVPRPEMAALARKTGGFEEAAAAIKELIRGFTSNGGGDREDNVGQSPWRRLGNGSKTSGAWQ